MQVDIKVFLEKISQLEKSQKFADALLATMEARKRFPQERIFIIRHAQLLERTKQFPLAITLYRQLLITSKDSAEPEVAIGLARSILKSGQYEQAEKLFNELYTKLPNDPDVLTGLATCRRQKGLLGEAERFIREALAINPDFQPALHELAEVLKANHQEEEALKVLEKNICRADLYGDSLDLWLEILKKQGRENYAIERLEELSRKFPHKVEFVYGLGVIFKEKDEFKKACKYFERAAKLSPNNWRILADWAMAVRFIGGVEESQSLIMKSVELNPDQPTLLRIYGSEHKCKYGDEFWKKLHFAAARLTEMPPLEQVNMHYALAKAFEDVGELDTAFRHYAIAGEKKRKIENYDEAKVFRMFQIIKSAITRKNYAFAPQKGYESEVPVFVLGMPRSGTSLLEQVFAAHPEVFGAGELKYLTQVLNNIQYGPIRLILDDAEAAFPYEQNAPWELRGQRYVELVERLAGRPYKRIVDKMPGNFMTVGLIKAILPQARIIHIRRHPVETCLSCYRIHFQEGHLWTYNLKELGRYYRQYWELMEHWRNEFPGIMYEVRYEDLVMNFEEEAKKLIEYLGLEWTDSCKEFYKLERPVKTASVTQVRKPIYKSSINRWRKYEKYLTPLLEEIWDIVQIYEKEIEHWLIELKKERGGK